MSEQQDAQLRTTVEEYLAAAQKISELEKQRSNIAAEISRMQSHHNARRDDLKQYVGRNRISRCVKTQDRSTVIIRHRETEVPPVTVYVEVEVYDMDGNLVRP